MHFVGLVKETIKFVKYGKKDQAEKVILNFTWKTDLMRPAEAMHLPNAVFCAACSFLGLVKKADF